MPAMKCTYFGPVIGFYLSKLASLKSLFLTITIFSISLLIQKIFYMIFLYDIINIFSHTKQYKQTRCLIRKPYHMLTTCFSASTRLSLDNRDRRVILFRYTLEDNIICWNVSCTIISISKLESNEYWK